MQKYSLYLWEINKIYGKIIKIDSYSNSEDAEKWAVSLLVEV